MEVLTNIVNGNLLDDFNGKLLNDKIQLSSNRGYPNNPNKKQEDAIGSIVKDENCFLNIVADGLGGSDYGKEASLILVSKLLSWFENVNESEINNTKKITKNLKKEIRKINRNICFMYQEYANTTFALSLTNNYHTIILNVGDSTVYTYNNEKLQLLTYIKFFSMFKTYEQIRKSLFNFMVGACIGEYPLYKIHEKIIDNNGQRIILSTDGVTDLISEKRFQNYFISKTDANQIVKDALLTPDIIRKSEDNISAITVELPNQQDKRKVKCFK